MCPDHLFFRFETVEVQCHYFDRTGLSNVWIGVILLATITSLPELVVGISSSVIVRSADLAVGDVLGSCAFNLGILTLMDVFVPKHQSLFDMASPGHVMAAAMGIILISLVGVGLYLPDNVGLIKWLGLLGVAFIVVYFSAMRLMYLFEKRINAVSVVAEQRSDYPLRKAISRFVLFAIVIVATALLLPTFADRLAEQSGLGKTFVGTLFLAAATSMPEIAVAVSSVRAGFVNLAIGNLLGSNLFNVCILAIDDLVYPGGPLLKDAADVHLASVLSISMMTGIAIIGLTYRSPKKRFLLAWDSMLIFLTYVLDIILLYQLTAS